MSGGFTRAEAERSRQTISLHRSANEVALSRFRRSDKVSWRRLFARQRAFGSPFVSDIQVGRTNALSSHSGRGVDASTTGIPPQRGRSQG